MREVLFAFEPGVNTHFEEAGRANSSPNLVVINVSPIEYGHVLLCPKVLDCIPQLLDPSTVLLALHFALEADNPYFRVGYNSLGAYATINHLHFQVSKGGLCSCILHHTAATSSSCVHVLTSTTM